MRDEVEEEQYPFGVAPTEDDVCTIYTNKIFLFVVKYHDVANSICS